MIKITNGTFGWYDGKAVVPLSKRTGVIDFLPEEVEKRLVEEEKIAEYVETPKPKENPPSVFELGQRKVEDLEYNDLQKFYTQLELGNPVSMKKVELIAAINKALDNVKSKDVVVEQNNNTEGSIIQTEETTEFGEVNPGNLVPEEQGTEPQGVVVPAEETTEVGETNPDNLVPEEQGDETEGLDNPETIVTEGEDVPPNLANVDGVV